jgi:hypothetical protein
VSRTSIQLKTRTKTLHVSLLTTSFEQTDKPFTDLYDTEGEGGYPGITFFARPVVGGHFSFLALERACGGEAMYALSFLDEHESRKSDEGEGASTVVGGHEL